MIDKLRMLELTSQEAREILTRKIHERVAETV